MKKKLVLLLVFLVAIFTLTGCEKKGKYYDGYKYLNFKEVLAAEEFELENKDYQENDNQAVIYLFRGQGCGFCRKFISFLNSISTEYGKYFKVVSFEVWYDGSNSDLMSKMPTVTNVEARGVPYIIIGDKVFDGYAESYDEEIKAKIMQQYNDPSYDVFDELAKSESKFGGFSNTAVIIINLCVVAIGTIIVSIVSNNNKREIIKTIEKVNKNIKKDQMYSENKETKKKNSKNDE